MFHKLRLKLTLTNVLVVGVIFLILMSGLYILMGVSLSRQSEQIMGIIAADAGSGPTGPRNMDRQRHWFRYFYVKTDITGHVVDRSPDIPINNEELAMLIKQALTNPGPRGRTRLEDNDKEEEFHFSKFPVNNTNKLITLVFINEKSETETLGRLLGALTFTGLLGLALAFFGSRLMAERALVPIKNSWERQKKFVADASHELRTPLTVIQTNLEVVIDNKDESVGSQMIWLENIKAENIRMNKLVEDLLFLARVDSDQEILDMKQFSLSDALMAATRPFEPLMTKQKITFKLDIRPNIIFTGDEYRIKQLVVNLIDNALKHTPSGGSITFSAKDKDSNINITVSDTGEGIPQEHQAKIFERFYRLDKARSRESGGTGLGLSITQWIVKKHGGTINLTSNPGKGTTFVMNLPNNKV